MFHLLFYSSIRDKMFGLTAKQETEANWHDSRVHSLSHILKQSDTNHLLATGAQPAQHMTTAGKYETGWNFKGSSHIKSESKSREERDVEQKKLP